MKILISGGGIAGMTAANLLHASGHEITVIDKAYEFTNAGFVLSLKSFGIDILKELSLETALRNKATLSNSVNFLKPNGKLVRQLSYKVIDRRLSRSLFAARGEIHNVIYRSVKDKVNIFMNTSIENVSQSNDSVKVLLSNNKFIDADLLIIAEGLRSSTRKICFENAVTEDFNIFYLAGRLKKKHKYELGIFRSYMGIKKMFAIFPMSKSELAVQCYIYDTGEVRSLQANAKSLLKASFEDLNEEVQTLITEVIESGLLFSDKMGMVHARDLVNGRVVLLGDAGYCPTPLSGMGASLSIYGAKALSYFLQQNARDVSKALQDYNNCLRPVIEKFQDNARKNAASFLPQNRAAFFLKNLLLKIAPEKMISNYISRELGSTDSQKNFSSA